MTMIAIACKGDTAEFITDTVTYTSEYSRIGEQTKHLSLPHLDCAVLTQGDTTFGNYAKSALMQASYQVDTFDELVEGAPGWIADMWAARQSDAAAQGREIDPEALVFLVGYSLRSKRFVSYAFPANAGFVPFETRGLWVIPTPWTARPSPYTLELFRSWAEEANRVWPPESQIDIDGLCSSWKSKPPILPPRDLDEWRAIAQEVRASRTLDQFCQCFVGGRVFHTTLRRGTTLTQEILRFDDDGAELQAIVAGTDHPLAQAMPCECGSGAQFVDCCRPGSLSDPCRCGSGKEFRACCLIAAHPDRVEGDA